MIEWNSKSEINHLQGQIILSMAKSKIVNIHSSQAIIDIIIHAKIFSYSSLVKYAQFPPAPLRLKNNRKEIKISMRIIDPQ